MRLIELRLKNLNSLKGEWHIDFSDAAFVNEGIFAITGQTGAGKTTILDAICLALYGQTPRLGDITASSNEIMTQGTGECSAEVIIEIGDKRYQCSWYQHRAFKKAKGNLLPIKHEISDLATGKILEEKKSKTTAYIQQLIGMDFNQFTRSIMLAQGSFAAFLKSDIGDRAAILEKITGTDIYAKISLNVHEKKRFEEEVLGKLQAGVNSLSLLSLADEQQLQDDLQAYQSDQQAARQKLGEVDAQIKWLDHGQDLEQKITIYQTEFNHAIQQQQAFIPEAKRLDIAHKALEIDRPFSELTYSRATVKRLDGEQQSLTHNLPAQQKLLEQAAIALSTATTLEEQAAKELHLTLPIISKVRQLDADIKQYAHALADDRQRKNLLVNNIQRLEQEIQHHTDTAKDTKAQLASTVQYLSDHRELNDLDSNIATFNSNGSRLKALLYDNANLVTDKLAYTNQAQQLQATVDTLSERRAIDKSRVLQQREQLTSLQDQQTALSKHQPVASMRGEQEQIDQLHTQIEHASVKLQQLAELATQIKNITSSQLTTNETLTTLDSSIKASESAIQEAKEKRQDKQIQLNLLQKVATLEDHITELEDGKPCPLCGAVAHPYGDHHPLLDNDVPDEHSATKQVQQQIEQLEAIISDLEPTLSQQRINHATKLNSFEHQQQQLALIHSQSKILCRELVHFMDTLSAPTVSTAPYTRSLSHISNDITALSQQLDSAGVSDISIDNMTTLLSKPSNARSLLADAKQGLIAQKEVLRSSLAQYDELTDAISQLNKEIERNEQQQFILSTEISAIATDLKLNVQKLEGLDHRIATNFSELKAIMTAVMAVVDTYPLSHYLSHHELHPVQLSEPMQDALAPLITSIDKQVVLNESDCNHHLDNLRQQRSALTQLKQQFNSRKHTQQTLDSQLASLVTQIETKQAQLDNENIEHNKLLQLIEDKNKMVAELTQRRKTLFADKVPDEALKRLQSTLDNVKLKKAAAQRQQDSAEHIIKQQQDRKQQLASELAAAMTILDKQATTFATLLTESQFTDEAAFVSARLPKEQREALNLRKQAVDNALQQARAQLHHTQQLLGEHHASPLMNPLTADDREMLAAKQQQMQAHIDQLIAQIGAITQKLADNEHLKGQQSSQLDAINAQKQTLQVWQQLHTLIGSADGKKFRTFAQGLTFQVMIKHANSQLQKMSDRYLLINDEYNALELNVIDNYQGGEVRSTKNLSGGEGFIISLALALGLSQMASHNIRVDSLFLDEGFGTLDEESLDIALDTLTSLQQEGKLIGIISHVQALKERILTQIQVKKLSGGFSQITGQGCYHIAN